MLRTAHISRVAGRSARGFGTLELIITLVIAGLLASVAVPSYQGYVNRARVSRAIGDISRIGLEIGRFQLRNNDALPASLDDLDADIPLDPWGRSYQYLNIPLAGPGVGGLRKDKNLNPLNTDFDLYSKGKDGQSAGPLSSAFSRDDVIRANNGAFVGKGEDY